MSSTRTRPMACSMKRPPAKHISPTTPRAGRAACAASRPTRWSSSRRSCRTQQHFSNHKEANMPLQKGSSKQVHSANVEELINSYKEKGKIGNITPKSAQHAREIANAIAYRQGGERRRR